MHKHEKPHDGAKHRAEARNDSAHGVHDAVAVAVHRVVDVHARDHADDCHYGLYSERHHERRASGATKAHMNRAQEGPNPAGDAGNHNDRESACRVEDSRQRRAVAASTESLGKLKNQRLKRTVAATMASTTHTYTRSSFCRFEKDAAKPKKLTIACVRATETTGNSSECNSE